MEEPVKGDVVVIPFPFSDLSTTKKRPALVVANPSGDDRILCQITSRARAENYLITLNNSDFLEGSLNLASFIRPDRLFTVDRSLILYKAATLKKEKMNCVTDKICEILRD